MGRGLGLWERKLHLGGLDGEGDISQGGGLVWEGI